MFKATDEAIRNTKTRTFGYVITRWNRTTDGCQMVEVWVPGTLRPVIWRASNTEAA